MARTVYTYGVYVIQLRKQAGPRQDERLPWVYVGQSSKTPEARLEQHVEGGMLASKAVHRYGIKLRPELYCDLPRVAVQREAEEMEGERATLLSRNGYTVRSDGERAFVPAGQRELWGRERVERSIDYLDGAVFHTVARLRGGGSIDQIVGLLWNDPSRPIQTLALDLLPFDEVGRFGHVLPAALRGRVTELADVGLLAEEGGRYSIAAARETGARSSR